MCEFNFVFLYAEYMEYIINPGFLYAYETTGRQNKYTYAVLFLCCYYAF